MIWVFSNPSPSPQTNIIYLWRHQDTSKESRKSREPFLTNIVFENVKVTPSRHDHHLGQRHHQLPNYPTISRPLEPEHRHWPEGHPDCWRKQARHAHISHSDFPIWLLLLQPQINICNGPTPGHLTRNSKKWSGAYVHRKWKLSETLSKVHDSGHAWHFCHTFVVVGSF